MFGGGYPRIGQWVKLPEIACSSRVCALSPVPECLNSRFDRSLTVTSARTRLRSGFLNFSSRPLRWRFRERTLLKRKIVHALIATAWAVVAFGPRVYATPTVVAPVPAAYTSSRQTASTGSLPVGAIKSLPVVGLDGVKLDLARVPGFKAIYFFSIFCPCVRSCEKISFKPLAVQYQGKVSFFAVTSGGWDLKDDRTNFEGLVETHHLPFPVVLDATHFVADTLGGQAASQVVVLSPDNHVVYSGMADDSKEYLDRTGQVGFTKTYLADALAAAVAGKPVQVTWTQPRGCSIAK